MTKHHQLHQPHLIGSLLIFILVLVLPGMVNGQVVGNGYNNSLIYKIRSETNTVYLMGSIHVLAEKYYPLTRAFSYAYYNSQKVVFEIDPEILFSPDFMKKNEKYYTLQDGKTLKSVLSPKAYSLLKKHLESIGINMDKVNKYKPWALLLSLGKRSKSSLEFRSDLGIENYFFRLAKDAGKPTGGLETTEDQLNVFDKLTFKEQGRLIIDAFASKSPKEQEKEFLTLVKNWHQGNLAGLERHVEEGKKFPKLHKAILEDRNRNWIPQIEEFLKEDKNVLVIVGAAHLAGEYGLLNLLTEKGYELERFSFVMP
jgi:uncharacterized protein YbaP (TraB family)